MSSFVVRSLVSAARGEVAAAAAAALGQMAAAVALNGSLNMLRETADGIREGRKSIGAQTLAGLVLSGLTFIEANFRDADALPAKGKEKADRQTRADAWGNERAAALLAAVDEAKAARKAAADDRAAKKAAEQPQGGPVNSSTQGDGNPAAVDPMTDNAPSLADALTRCAAFNVESLADAIKGNEAARERLSQALAFLAAADAAAVVADAVSAADAAAAVVADAAASSAAAVVAMPQKAGKGSRKGAKAEKLAA